MDLWKCCFVEKIEHPIMFNCRQCRGRPCGHPFINNVVLVRLCGHPLFYNVYWRQCRGRPCGHPIMLYWRQCRGRPCGHPFLLLHLGGHKGGPYIVMTDSICQVGPSIIFYTMDIVNGCNGFKCCDHIAKGFGLFVCVIDLRKTY